MKNEQGSCVSIVVRQIGARCQGCDESSGWIWFASRVLLDCMESNFDIKGKRILELGSGTGWLALELATRGAVVTATERSGALTLLWQNVLSNQNKFPVLDTINVQELEWNSLHRLVGDWDLVIGSDLMYLHEHYLPLLQTLVRHGTREFVMVFEERKPHEEANFAILATSLGFSVQPLLSTEANPTTKNPTWLLRMTM